MKMVRKTFVLCVLLSLTTSAYGAFTWVQPANQDGACGNVDENTAHGPLDPSTDITVTSDAGNHIDYDVVSQPAGDIVLSIHGHGPMNPANIHIDQGTIDYEAAQELVLVFTVTDQAPATATGTCTITVNDLNEAPVFAANQVVFVDQLVTGTTVTSTFTATDPDGTPPNNQIMSYALDGPVNASPLFAVNAGNGEITLLDVTGTCDPTYNLVISAEDGGTPALTGIGTLTVNMFACGFTTAEPVQTTTVDQAQTTTADPAQPPTDDPGNGVSGVSHSWVTACVTLAAVCLQVVYCLE